MTHIMTFFILLTFASNLSGVQNQPPKIPLKMALSKLKTALENEEKLSANPLQSYNFEKLASKSYLYFYRAQGYARIAKNSSQKLINLNKALSDLEQAQLYPNFNNEAIAQLSNQVLKGKIEAALAQKMHQSVIDSIERLSPKDKSDIRYILYYGQALYHLSRHDEFKKLARNYLSVFKDEKTIRNYLLAPPPWTELLSSLSESSPVPRVSSVAGPLKYSKNMLLSDPKQALASLHKNVYFSNQKELFDPASKLYFSLYKKETLNAQEKKFLTTFRAQMYSFAPAYIDSLIFSHWKLAELKIADRLSTAFLRQFEGHPLYPKILYNLGRIQEDAQNYLDAHKTFKQYIAKADISPYLELARFRVGWLLYLAKREKDAKPYFEEYLKNYPEGRYASTSEYSIIKINNNDKNHVNKEQDIANYISKYPLSIYAFILIDEFNLPDSIVRQYLSQENNLRDKSIELQEFRADIKTLNRLNLSSELASLGLKDEAIKVLKDFSSSQDELFNLYLASQFQSLDDTHGEVTSLMKLTSQPNSLREYVPWTRLYPDYRRESIEKEIALQNSSLCPLLVLSLIRQESAFNPSALSSAKAQGLMQLTDGTAQKAAKNLNLERFSLFKEEDNLKLGINTLSALLKKFDNRIDYALSAYNAGETPTRLWIKLRGHLEPMAWVESIPYPETRTYIRTILRNYAVYQMLYKTRDQVTSTI